MGLVARVDHHEEEGVVRDDGRQAILAPPRSAHDHGWSAARAVGQPTDVLVHLAGEVAGLMAPGDRLRLVDLRVHEWTHAVRPAFLVQVGECLLGERVLIGHVGALVDDAQPLARGERARSQDELAEDRVRRLVEEEDARDLVVRALSNHPRVGEDSLVPGAPGQTRVVPLEERVPRPEPFDRHGPHLSPVPGSFERRLGPEEALASGDELSQPRIGERGSRLLGPRGGLDEPLEPLEVARGRPLVERLVGPARLPRVGLPRLLRDDRSRSGGGGRLVVQTPEDADDGIQYEQGHSVHARLLTVNGR